ncbi:MAG: glycolate oxidase subunit GlcE [Gammaproteobacteria bacterium]|jgi:glycolate oxidase FAD binding subunit
MSEQDKSNELAALVVDAISNKRVLNITGGNSKAFYGRKAEGEVITTSEHSGVTNYEPGELVITARAGTRLNEIESLLKSKNQRLVFEPPHFSDTATLGGAIATGINGLCRPWSGSARDSVLGVKMINGQAEILSFGGEVMKNVAGYDISRLMTGSLGTLGILLEVSLKVLPLSEKTETIIIDCNDANVIQRCVEINKQFLPVTAMTYYNKQLYIRLSGNAASVDAAVKQLEGDVNEAKDFWNSIKEQTHSFFNQAGTLWRISVPPAASWMKELSGEWLIDWAGAQRWFISDMEVEDIRKKVKAANGHATIFRNDNNADDVFQPLTSAQLHIHRMIRKAFDPNNVFNSGRLYKNI